MSISMPTRCANPECGRSSIRPIHSSARPVAIDAVDGPPVYAHHITYRCADCGHTWAVRGYSAEHDAPSSRVVAKVPNGQLSTVGRGW